jgi:3-hydroxy-3-methylglutaryl CoA synthase
MAGILSYGAYVPVSRLDRAAIAATLGSGGGRGARAVASYDEDTTSMGVEAARRALASLPSGSRVEGLYFATAVPGYLDKTNATAIHAALDLDGSAPAYDMIGSARSGIGAMRAAADTADAGRVTMAVLADIRTGNPGGAEEAQGGDAAAAVVFAAGGPLLAEHLATASSTAEFLDRWRVPGEAASRQWEERFGETAYLPLAEAAFTDACKKAGITAEQVDHLIVTSLHSRAAKGAARATGVRAEALVDDRSATVGNTGTAAAGLLLADVLDRAEPGQVVVLLSLADGADVTVWRTTAALPAFRQGRTTVAAMVDTGTRPVSYANFLTWRGMLHREPPRRPDPTRPAAPPTYRHERWKYAFAASRCENCGTRHLPPQRVCVQCHTVDRMTEERLAVVPATIATFTVDRLAFSLSPPVVAAVIDFDGGGRFNCELTDVDPAAVRIGQRVEMTFRRLYTADGVQNYFWKARPLTTGGD